MPELPSSATINHLHIKVLDLGVSEDYYVSNFGFRKAFDVNKPDRKIRFLNNQSGFVLALETNEEDWTMPSWFHFGIKLATGSEVKAAYQALTSSAVGVLGEVEERGPLTSFVAVDPDGYHIQVFSE